VEKLLQKLKEACRESRPAENAKLQDIVIQPQTGEVRFVWQDEE
jgi:hypothetical protein